MISHASVNVTKHPKIPAYALKRKRLRYQDKTLPEEDIQDIADRLCDMLVHLPTSDPQALADLGDWFGSLKFSPLRNRQQNLIRVSEAAAIVLEKMVEQNRGHGATVFPGARNTLPVFNRTAVHTKPQIKRLLMQEIERIDQKADVKY